MSEYHDEDLRMEAYLRSFTPRQPGPLPARRRPWMAAGLGLAAAVLLAVGLLRIHQTNPIPPERPALTIGAVNELVAAAPSGLGLLDDVGFALPPPRTSAAEGGASALEFLSKEDFAR